MEAKEQLNEINQHISDALEQWATIMWVAEADEWSHYLNYNYNDAFNAIKICVHVLQNIAIKSGYIKNEDDVIERSIAFRKAVKDFCGLSTNELGDMILNNK